MQPLRSETNMKTIENFKISPLPKCHLLEGLQEEIYQH